MHQNQTRLKTVSIGFTALAVRPTRCLPSGVWTARVRARGHNTRVGPPRIFALSGRPDALQRIFAEKPAAKRFVDLAGWRSLKSRDRVNSCEFRSAVALAKQASAAVPSSSVATIRRLTRTRQIGVGCYLLLSLRDF
jgi:hypothetical protein